MRGDAPVSIGGMDYKPPTARERLEEDVCYLVEKVLGTHHKKIALRNKVIDKIMAVLDEAADGGVG